MTVKAYDKDIHFNIVDVAVDSIALPSLVCVTIKYSKADGGRKKGNQIYPVGALMAYIIRRGSEDGPFFRFKDGHLLTKDCLLWKYRSSITGWNKH